ncbi:pyridoxal phosphate-dependent transferase [Schizophyllum fasciatum]
MGNTHSQKRKHHHAQSKAVSRIHLGCHSFDSISTLHYEKAALDDRLVPSTDYDCHCLSKKRSFDLSHKQSIRTFNYKLTWIIDALRRSDYQRLDSAGETYVDYMGGALYPESLLRVHTDFLSQVVMGNTHSASDPSRLSLKYATEARQAVLSFFKAPPGYTVVFTANASAALKLVGESYPFSAESCFVLPVDSHNSVNGIRQFALARRAKVEYIPSTPCGGLLEAEAKSILLRSRPRLRDKKHPTSLFGFTGQSNISNYKPSLSILKYASALGYHTLLDAAALAPTSTLSLAEHPVDAMAISFYKMFGFPTGVGALVVKKTFLAQLRRPWFSGGTVNVVQVPGPVVTMTTDLHERFEDGTINYLSLPAVTDGLQFLSAYLPFIPLRLSCLMHYLSRALARIRHDVNGLSVVRILSKTPARRLRSVGDQSDAGSTISFIFLSPSGEMIPLSFVDFAASKFSISLRTGCMCNPGGAAALLNITNAMGALQDGVTHQDFQEVVGRELGVVRVSLGLASNFQDAWRVVQFAAMLGRERERIALWDQYAEGRRHAEDQGAGTWPLE